MQIPNGSLAYDSVTMALKAGYRHIDSAANYKNEPSVGQAIKDFGLPRDEVFVPPNSNRSLGNHTMKP